MTMKDTFTEGLDPEQREAVCSAGGHLLVAAPPGSGKTRVLASLFARLVEEAGPARVLAVTFTNRAAREMAERVESLTGRKVGAGGAGGGGGHRIGTFHAVCLAILRDRLGPFSLWGREETVAALKDLGVKSPARTAERISFIKNTGAKPTAEEREALEAYSRRLAEAAALDLDDLVPETSRLLEEDGGKRLFAHVLVDEYQDINPVQARLAGLLSGPSGTVAAIGDPDQSIYGFRGSTPECFLRFTAERPKATVVRLVNNYRSAETIVEAASSVISNNPGRTGAEMKPVRPGGVVTVVEAPDEKAEAGFVVREIERLMGGLTSLTVGGGGEDYRFSDFAVLARTNAMAEAVAGELARTSVPFQLVGPQGAGFSAFAARLRAAGPGPGEGVAEVVAREAEAADIDDSTAALFIREARAFETTWAGDPKGGAALRAFAEAMTLTGPADRFDIEADRVGVMTMHMTKGLEFPVVFIVGAEDGIIPFRPSSNETDTEEERRLFFVAMTRARDRLYITRAGTRRLWGRTTSQKTSPFVAEVPERLVKTIRIEKKKARRRPTQGGLFD